MKNFKNTLSFEIQETPVLYNHNGEVITSESHKVISKVETGESLSVMKNSYSPMYNKDFMETVDRMQEVSGFKFEGYSEIDKGRIILAHLKNNGDYQIGDDHIKDYLLLGSSFDGRFPFFIGTTSEFIWCKNQFSKISKFEKVRHTKSAPKKREELMIGLEVYFKNRQKMYENFEKMKTIKVDEEIIKMAKDYILSVSEEDRLDGKISTRKLNQLELLNSSMIIELEHFGQNMLGVFNGVTRHTTYNLKQKENVFGNVFGTASILNNRAYEFCLGKL